MTDPAHDQEKRKARQEAMQALMDRPVIVPTSIEEIDDFIRARAAEAKASPAAAAKSEGAETVGERGRKGPPGGERKLLTEKQMRFADFVSAGYTGSEAYRNAYDARAMSGASIAVEASRLLANPKVMARIEERQRAIDGMNSTALASLRPRAIERIWALAIGAKSETVQLNALKLFGEIPEIGLFTPPKGNEGRSLEDIERELSNAIKQLRSANPKPPSE